MIIPAPPNLWATYTSTAGTPRYLPVVGFTTNLRPGEVAALVCTDDGELTYANDTEPAPGYVLERVTHRPQ